MVETVNWSKIYAEDFDLGEGTREVRLQNGYLAALHRVHIGRMLPHARYILSSSNGASALTANGALAVGWRVMGVTVEVLETFGNSNGLTGLSIGDTELAGRWGVEIGRTTGTQTTFVDAPDDSMPIYRTASNLVIRAIGGTFDATGRLEAKIHYWVLTHH